MLARLQGVTGQHYTDGKEYNQRSGQPRRDRPRVDYYETRNLPDPCPDPSLLDPLDAFQHNEIMSATEQMLSRAAANGLPEELQPKLRKLVKEHLDVFRIGFSHGKPARIPPLHIELMDDTTPIKVQLRNYSEAQRQFLSDMTTKLVEGGMAFPNPTARWVSAPLLVPNPGSSTFWFTVDLRLVNRYTKQHSFPMPRLENEMTKLTGSKFFANFDLSHGY